MPTVDPLSTFTLADLADLLQVSERYVQDELVAGRRIGYLRVGPRTIRVTRPQIETFYGEVAVPLPQTPALTVVADIAPRRVA